jgi:DNA polymerase-1
MDHSELFDIPTYRTYVSEEFDCSLVHYINDPAHVPAEIPGPVLYLDIETYGVGSRSALDLLTNEIRLISVCGESGPAYVFDMYRVRPDHLFHLFRQDAVWCGHNLVFDLSSLRRAGFPYPTTCFDTLVCSQVLMNGMDFRIHGGHRLAECLERYCDIRLKKEHGADDWKVEQLTAEQIVYSGNDVFFLRPLREQLVFRLNKFGLTTTAGLECSCVPPLVDMTLTGICIDRNIWLERSVRAEGRVGELQEDLDKLFPLPDELPKKKVRYKSNGDPYIVDIKYNARVEEKNATRRWNWASWQQVLEAFSRVGVVLPDTTYETLVVRKDDHPGVRLLLDYKDVEKEATTFGRDWLKHLRNERGENRVHPTWRQLGAESGRMSCAGPNMQQVPRGAVRKAVIAPPGYLMVRADFSQIEARIAAKISGDQTLSDLFINNTGDIHRFTASRVLGKDPKDVTKEDRQIGKSLLFGLLFGMGPDSLLVYCRTNYGVTLTPAQAVDFRNRFFEVFPGLKFWHKRVGSVCEGKIDFRTLMGRRRLIMGKESKYTEALNTPVQGTGADLLKMTVKEMWDERDQWPGVNLVALIHDEVMYYVPEAVAEEFGRRLREKMIEVGNMLLDPIPVDAEVKIGPAWSS